MQADADPQDKVSPARGELVFPFASKGSDDRLGLLADSPVSGRSSSLHALFDYHFVVEQKVYHSA